jgi:TRAP transporter TAXI family solute receptor
LAAWEILNLAAHPDLSRFDALNESGLKHLTPICDGGNHHSHLKGCNGYLLADGNIDAALWSGSFPLAPVVRLAATNDLRLIPVDNDFFATLQAAYPPYFRLSIPGGTYDDVAEDTPSYGLANGLVISADVPEDMVYNMTRAVFENLDHLATVHPAFGNVSAETVLDGFGSPLHPGALRYYREIGLPGIEEFVTRTGG